MAAIPIAAKARIRETRLRAALAANSEPISLDWQIGRDIRERQAAYGRGAKVVDRLTAALRAEFPDSRGFSSVNLRPMRAFAAAWPDPVILRRVVGRLPCHDQWDTAETKVKFANDLCRSMTAECKQSLFTRRL